MKGWLLVALAGVAACEQPLIPDRAGVYSFADTAIIGTDTTVFLFHWPTGRLPVRFWADPRGNMRFLVRRAVGAWESQFLYGEFAGGLVGDSGGADVIVRWADSVPPDVPPDTSHVFACSGVTRYSLDSASSALDAPMHVELSVNRFTTFTAAQVAACMQRISIHELGHALGIARHSPRTEDIMAPNPTADLPSPFDRHTVEMLYHTPSTVLPAPP